MTGDRPTILFLLRNLYYLRNFEAPIRALADRGYRIVILADPTKRLPGEIGEQVANLRAAYPASIRFADAHGRGDFRARLADDIRTSRDVLRYRTAPFREATSLRRRAIAKATPLARLVYDRDSYNDPARNAAADRRLAAWNEQLPPDPSILSRLRDIAPSVLVVSPLVDFRSDQIDWAVAARALGIPSVLAVASWDNLTNKSRIQARIDRVLVWNETQRREAVDLHGIDAGLVVVTGAQLYDDWFVRGPTLSREDFCAEQGFDPAQPIILYVGSSSAIAPDEPAFVRDWLTAIRGAQSPALAGANALIRPHPMNGAGYETIDLTSFAPAAVSPQAGGLPVTERERAAYFDAVFHAAAVVGLNTSALIEASILRKPCFTVAASRNRAGQHETLHYRYLTAARILREAPDLAAHCVDLATALARPVDGEAADAFVADFLRPHGRADAATPRFVTAVEAMIRLPLAPAASRGGLSIDTAAFLAASGYGIAGALRRLFAPRAGQAISER